MSIHSKTIQLTYHSKLLYSKWILSQLFVDFILYFWALVVPVFAPFDPIGTILIKKSFCCLGLRLVSMKFSFIACLILFWLFSHALKSMLTGAVWPDSWLIFLIIWPFTTVKIEWLHKNIRVEKFAKYYLNEPSHNCQIILTFCQSGEISPNFVILYYWTRRKFK